ncbi:MAG: AsmA family protein [Hyphomicrobiaceae bacterium]|nr:AsmA family protein [Hyphomicrobiaceae bacterium]
MQTALKIIGILVLVLIFVIGGAIVALPYFFSTDLVKSKVAELVESQTGRKLDIRGDTSFKLFPNIAVSLGNITLSNPPGMDGEPLVRMSSLRANLKLMPLLTGKAVIDSLSLVKPQFNLLVDKRGLRNWDFAQSGGASRADNGGRNDQSGSALTVGTLTIKDGSVHFINKQSAIDEELQTINFVLTQHKTRRSLKADGYLRWRNEKFSLTSTIDDPDALLAGKASNLLFRVNSRLTNSRFEGLLDPAQPLIEGKIVSDTPSVQRFAAFLGHDLPSNEGFGKLKISSTLTAKEDSVEFATSQFLFDNMDLSARGRVDLSKERPNITAHLRADRINLNLYLGGANGTAGSSTGQSDTADTPVDLSALKAIDGHFTLKADEILYGKARLGAGDYEVTLKEGRANASINQLSLYRGTATGKLVLDGSRATYVIGAKFNLKNVLTGAILRDFAGFDKLAGKGSLSGDLSMRGNSVKALKSSLKGTTKINLSKGRIEGFDLAKYVENFTGNKIPGSGEGYEGKPTTAYDKMTALIQINKGVARNKDFLLKGRFFRVRAAGTVDIPGQSLRLRMAPKLFSGDWKFAPPLRATGPWSNPNVEFDTVAFLGGSNGVLNTVRGLLAGDRVDLGSVLKNRGLQSDAEIEAYLSGKKIDTSKDRRPANESEPAGGVTDSPLAKLLSGGKKNGGALGQLLGGNKNKNGGLGGLLGGNKKNGTENLLKNLFQ